MESYLAEDKGSERERERGILSCCKGSPPSAPRLPRGHVDVDVDMARLGPCSSLLIAWPAGAHLSCTRLPLSFSYSTLFFGTDFPGPSGQSIMTSTSTLLAVTVSFPFRAFCHEICKAQLKNFLFVLIKQSFSILSFSF